MNLKFKLSLQNNPFGKVFLLLLITALTSCTTKNIDLETYKVLAKDQQQYQQSITTLNKQLSHTKRKQFQLALAKIRFSDSKKVSDLVNGTDMFYKKINGLTYQEILQLSEESNTKIKISY